MHRRECRRSAGTARRSDAWSSRRRPRQRSAAGLGLGLGDQFLHGLDALRRRNDQRARHLADRHHGDEIARRRRSSCSDRSPARWCATWIAPGSCSRPDRPWRPPPSRCVPPAPPLVLDHDRWPSRLRQLVEHQPDITSAPVPGAIGTIARIGLFGQFAPICAAAPPHAAAKRPHATATLRRRAMCCMHARITASRCPPPWRARRCPSRRPRSISGIPAASSPAARCRAWPAAP